MTRLKLAYSASMFAAGVMLAPAAGFADVLGSAFLNNANAGNAVIGFAHGAADATFTVPSPTNGACTGGFAGDTLCFFTGSSDVTSLGAFLSGGGATVQTGSAAALNHILDNTVLEFTGTVTVTTGEQFSVGHDDGLQLQIGNTLVIDTPGATPPTITTDTYTGPSGTFAFDLVYGECCGGSAELAISLPLQSNIPEPMSLALLGFALTGFVAVRRSFSS